MLPRYWIMSLSKIKSAWNAHVEVMNKNVFFSMCREELLWLEFDDLGDDKSIAYALFGFSAPYRSIGTWFHQKHDVDVNHIFR